MKPSEHLEIEVILKYFLLTGFISLHFSQHKVKMEK